MSKNKLADLQAQINSVQAQISQAMEQRENLRAEYDEALKIVAKELVDEAVAEYGYGIVNPIFDVAQNLMAVFPLPPEESSTPEGTEGVEFDNIPLNPPTF